MTTSFRFLARRLLLRLLPVLALLAVTPGARAQTPPLATLQAAGSELVFTIRQMGVPVEGRFERFQAQIAFDPRQPARVGITIDTGSARFGAREIDAEVPKPAWLGAVAFPQASFRSTTIKALGGGRFEVGGELTLKGRAQPVIVPVQITQSGRQSTARGSFAVKRLAFGIGEGEWADTSLVADEVQVRFSFALDGLPPL
jgi:polyisoprenoid-binding protein YceI